MGQSVHQARYLWGAVQEVALPLKSRALLLCHGWSTCPESSHDLYTNVHLALSLGLYGQPGLAWSLKLQPAYFLYCIDKMTEPQMG